MRQAYCLAAALLGAHEVDSGFWREWELFGLPGGAAAFVALHVGMFLLILWGYGQVVGGGRTAGAVMSLVLGAAGVFALGIHGWHLAHGDERFRSLTSVVVLAGLGLMGAYLGAVAVRELLARRAQPRAS